MNRRPIEPLKLVEIERFAKKFKINGENGCWEWCASKNQKGYGQFDMNRIQYKAHRVSYAIKHDGLDSQLQTDHLCRNRACVNPDHLELVTNRENVLRVSCQGFQKNVSLTKHIANVGMNLRKRIHTLHMQTEATGKIYQARHCLACRRLRTKAIAKARIRLQGATMTPTEQDKELREKLVETILSILGITDRSSGNRSEQIATLEQEIVSYITADSKRVALEARKVTGDTSDGYHTFNELYDYRRVYNAALFNEWASQGKYDVHKSWKHSDGKDCFGGGWFIVVAELPTGQASNHYEAQYWDNFVIPSKDTANEYDGHTPNQALSRIAQLRSTQ